MRIKFYFIIITGVLLAVVIVTQLACKKESEPELEPEQSGQFTDPRDGKVYSIVQIGSQTWFAENLNFNSTNSWWNDNSPANGDIYGRLYRWDDAISACPQGWHLPDDEEWKTLEIFLGMSQSEADEYGWRGTDECKKLKSTTGWNSGGNGTDEVGFSALPGGARTYSGDFGGVGDAGYWWSATPADSEMAWYRTLKSYDDRVYRLDGQIVRGHSVRCIKD